MEFKLLADTRSEVSEGPVWDDRRNVVFFVDINKPAICRVALDGSGFTSWAMPRPVGSIGLTESGRLIAALWHDLAVFDPDSGTLTALGRLEGEPDQDRLNDGKVGPDGAFWVGTMDTVAPRKPIGSLYRVTGDGRIEKKATGFHVSNGLAFSPDGKAMYHSDSSGPWVDRWALDAATGAISGRTRYLDLTEAIGRPDGAATDADGCYWSAGVSAGRLNRFAPDGRLVAHFAAPVPAPTMPCFCGPDLKTVVLTSLQPGWMKTWRETAPMSGSVFVARGSVAGSPVPRMRGL